MDIITAARTFMGVPFRHQGRNKLGVDCLGLVLLSAEMSGVKLQDLKGYARSPDGHTLKSECGKQLIPVKLRDIQDGDILLMSFRREPQHLAIKTNIGIIHSYQDSGGVVEHGLDDRWLKRIRGAYRIG